MSAPQGTPEWFAERCGFATASRFKDILAKIKSGEAASRRNYKAATVAERLTGKPAETFTNAAMQWGTDNEPIARMMYEALTGAVVQEVGFIRHPTIEFCGASPDGLVGDSGMVEIKCPNTATHIETLLSGMDAGHIPQVQGQMWVCRRQWVDFVSFDPRMPERMQLHVQRIERNDEYINNLQSEVTVFLGEVDALIAKLNERKAA